ncbi:MAG: NTP/NDP exchange transporter, partial [Chlamydiae bacterium]|nr:NTP/NDP exchange transporter [Chlamydiota bacterium]
WPVQRGEYGKLIPLLVMQFFASFNFTVLHAMKDTLIITSKGSGAEAIPILKGLFVLVFAFLAMVIYAKLSNILSRSKLFYATIIPFLLFFLSYAFVLYPYRESLAPHESANWLVSFFGKKREHFIAVYRYWTDSLLFLVAELWGSIVITLLFWGFANRVNNLQEASRFYTLFSAGGQVGVICASPLIWFFATHFTDYKLTIQWLMGLVIFGTLVIMAGFSWLSKRLSLAEKTAPPNKRSASLKKSCLLVLRSPTLGAIALMVIGYGLCVNMIEVSWKALLKKQYPLPADYQAFMGVLSGITGVTSLLLALFVGGNLIRKWGWYPAALSAPLIIGITTGIFFLVYFVSTTLTLIILAGAFHHVLCKSMKYCLFDTTKEMAYIPLDSETQTKGKPAVDVVATRLGQAGSSWIQTGLLELFGAGSILSITPYLAPFILLSLTAWLFGIRQLKGPALESTLE